MGEHLARIMLPAAVARAIRERAERCGLPMDRTLVQLLEVALASERCPHAARAGRAEPPAAAGEDDEDAS